ncbi:MAG: class I SAM-dependent methyltransferase [Saprospiraceae bacterium]|nr:class I SAM-dependent methyltransferase [Saprospiraceae bacterium]
MKKRGLWIFDENYLMLTYLSACSFAEHSDVIITLIYCGEKMNDADLEIFQAIQEKVEVYYFTKDVSEWEAHMQANILNRLARLHFTKLFEDDLVFMIDSDVAFSEILNKKIKHVEERFNNHESIFPVISGVVEFLSASDAYLYFKKKDKAGFTRKTNESAKLNVYTRIYGSDWKSYISGFQFNNGFLIFYKARKLIEQWEHYYLAGLHDADVNPLDDQVPLAAAIQKTECTYWKMDPQWNSLGDLDGPFVMFHAWGGEWKIEIDQVLRNAEATSDYGNICKRYLTNCPAVWIKKFFSDLKSFPYRYRNIQGAFDHGTVFTDLIKRLESGKIVEVGTYKGRSACFLAELIKASGKNIQFTTIDHFERSDTSMQLVQKNLKRADVQDYVTVVEGESYETTKLFKEEELDFIFLDTDSSKNRLAVELESWYEKLKEGGILGGYDHSIHDTVFKSYDCASWSFCEKHAIPLMTYEYQFLIQKPFKTK